MGRQLDTKIKPIRSYYNENDKVNSDYDQVLPISIFDAIFETTEPDAINLTTMTAQINQQLNNIVVTKQNVIQPGTSGSIAIFTGEDGVLGELPKIDIITSTPESASSNKIVTEKAIVDFHENVLKPEIENVGGLSDKVTALENDRTAMQNDITGLTGQITGLNDGLSSKANQTEVDDVRIIAEGKCDAADLNVIAADVTQAKLDIQGKISKNAPITSGSYTKVLVDTNGLVTSGSNITSDDMPDIDMSKVIGLDTAMAEKVGTDSISGLQNDIDGKMTANVPITPGVATKVTYDAKGLITDASSLTIDDIPIINIDKVEGLQAALDASGSESSITDIRNQLDNKIDKNVAIVAGTGTKVSYDTNGLIISSTSLTDEDMPVTLTNKINDIETQLPSFVSQSAVDSLQSDIDSKMTGNVAIVAGTATKITYDAKGLVIAGESLTKSDLPTLGTTDISGLSEALADIITTEDITALTQTVAGKADQTSVDTITGRLDTVDTAIADINSQLISPDHTHEIADVTGLQTELDSKATIVASTVPPTETLSDNVLYCVYE